MTIFNALLQYDRELFFKINTDWSNSFFDTLLPFIRNAVTWMPFYVFLLFFVTLNFRKSGWYWVLLAAALAASTDIVSSHIIKENIFRLRPCRDLELAGQVRFLLNHCGQNSSFTSSHATNHFGFAIFLFLTLKNFAGKWIWIVFLWAAAIAYAQVYVGVHYPLDVFCGALVGLMIGFGFAKIFNRYIGLQQSL